MKNIVIPKPPRFFQRARDLAKDPTRSGDPLLRLKNGSAQDDAGRDTMKRDWLK